MLATSYYLMRAIGWGKRKLESGSEVTLVKGMNCIGWAGWAYRYKNHVWTRRSKG